MLERITHMNKALVPHVAQAMAASMIEAISGRVAAARERAWPELSN